MNSPCKHQDRVSTLRKSAPVIVTAFINRFGSIGLSLLSMVLIEKGLSSAQSSIIMGWIQSMGLIGLVAGGMIADRSSFRAIMLLSLGLMAIGFFCIPYSATSLALGAAASVAQIGTVFYQSSIRMVLMDSVDSGERQEAIGWLRMGSNLGQVFSYSLGALAWRAGTSLLMFLDGGTSLLAMAIGFLWLPSKKAKPIHRDSNASVTRPSGAQWRFFVLFTVLLAGFTFMEELFLIGSSALIKLRFGAEGLYVFSTMMVVNTVVCTLLAIPAARIFEGAASAFYYGITLFALGSTLVLTPAGSHWIIYLGMFVVTLGEVAFTSMSQYMSIEALPQAKGQGSLYGVSMMIQMLGKILSGALAFPLIAHGKHPQILMLLIGACLLFWIWLIQPSLNGALERTRKTGRTEWVPA